MPRSKLINLCQTYHGLIHLLFGLLAFTICAITWPTTLFNISGLLVAVVVSFLPDLDHFLFYYIYGRDTNYSKVVRSLLASRHFREYYHFVLSNHKDNYYIWSHNFGTPILCFILFLTSTNHFWQLFFLAFSFHFVFDILEDLLVHGRFNPNWYFRFSKANL